MKIVLVPSSIRDWRLQKKIEIALQALSLLFVAWLALAFVPAALTTEISEFLVAYCFIVLCFLPPLWIAYRYGWQSAVQ